ncbi:MAG: MDR family MFS transporter [Actinomycetota bacterium]
MQRPTVRQNLRAMPREAWFLFAGAFVNRLGTFVLPFIVLYLTKAGFSAPQAGGAIAAYGVGGLLAQGIGGVVADRLGRRNTIGAAMLLAALFTLALWQAHSLVVIYAVMVCLALCAEMHRPATGALIADLLPPDRRVTAYTMYRLAVNTGWAVGLALGGFLAVHAFSYLFVGDAITSAAFGVIALVALPHGVRTSRISERHLGTARSSIAADRGFLLFLAGALLIAIVYSQNVSTLPLHIRDTGHPPSTYGLLQSLNGVLIVLFELPITAWTMHRSRTAIVAVGGLCVGAAFCSLAFARSVPALTLAIVVWTIGEMLESPVASAYVADRAPEHARGRYQAAYGSMFGVAWIVGPLLGTSLYAIRPGLLWLACGVLALIGAGLVTASGRRPAPAAGGEPLPEPSLS